MVVTTRARISAITTANQMPLIPRIIGRNNTDKVSNTNNLENAMIAEIRPMFNAVKNAEP